MPTYEYLCQTCSHRFETWQKMTDEPLTICPECGNKIRRVLYPAGIVFKGSGFYKTDHGSGSYPASGEEKKLEGNGEKKSESNGDKKASDTSESHSSSTSKPAESTASTSSPSTAAAD